MYDSITTKFKNSLIDRKFDIKSYCIMFAILVAYAIIITTTWIIFKSQLIFGLSTGCLILLEWFSLNILIFTTAKQSSNVKIKDFLNYRKLFRCMREATKKDTFILNPIIEEFGINTRPRIQEAIRHYQFLLQRKTKANFTAVPIISVVVSVIGIIVSYFKSGPDSVIPCIILMSVAIIVVIIVCFAIQKIYKDCIYCLTEYAIYERIEAALSEIWMTKKS